MNDIIVDDDPELSREYDRRLYAHCPGGGLVYFSIDYLVASYARLRDAGDETAGDIGQELGLLQGELYDVAFERAKRSGDLLESGGLGAGTPLADRDPLDASPAWRLVMSEHLAALRNAAGGDDPDAYDRARRVTREWARSEGIRYQTAAEQRAELAALCEQLRRERNAAAENAPRAR